MPEYRLLLEHRIDKVLQPVGAIVMLPEQIGEWLVSQGKTERIDGNAPRVVSAPVVVSAPRHAFLNGSPRWSCCGKKP